MSKKFLLLIGFVVVVVVAAIVVFVASRGEVLSTAQISEKFDCDRKTLEARDTDVFCENPDFYNNPEGVSRNDFYKYYKCEERINKGPSMTSVEIDNQSFLEALSSCQSKSRLEELRQTFITDLQELKLKAQ